MIKYIFLILCFATLSTKAQSSDDSIRRALLIDTLNMVDWALNNEFFFLTTDKGIRASVGSKAYKKLSKEYHNDIILVSKGGTYLWIQAFLLASFQSLSFYITDKNGYIPSGRKFYSKEFFFVTNRGIFVGMTEDDFLKKSKNLPYKINSVKGGKTFEFESTKLASIVTNIGLIYRAFYFFEKGRLVSFTFGFI